MAMLKLVLLAWKQDFMTRALVDENCRNTAKDRYQGDQPPGEPDHPDFQARTVPGTREDWADGSERG